MKILRWAAAVAFAFATIAVIAAPPRERQQPKAYISNLLYPPEEHTDMAIIRWVSTDGDGANTASWEGGVRPNADSDIALLDGIGSQVSWTTGMAGHGAAVVYSTADFKGDIGSSGAYLTLVGAFGAGTQVIKGVFNHRGKLFVDLQRSGGGNANLASMVIGMPLAGVDNAHIDGDFGKLYIKSGGVTFDASLKINDGGTGTLEIFGGRTLISSGVTLAGSPNIYGGYVESQLSMTPIMYGGRLFQRKLLTGLSIFGGAHVRYLPVPFATGNMALILWDGSLDVVGNPADVFSAVVTGALIGPNFRLIGEPDIAAVGRIDLRDEFPVLGT